MTEATNDDAANVAPAPRTQRTPKRDWKATFLGHLAQCGNVSMAAKCANRSRSFVYASRNADTEFAAQWDEAVDVAADALEAEARRRAVEGTFVFKFDKNGNPLKDPRTGEPYRELAYSDTLLIFLLKGARPEKDRDNATFTHNHKANVVLKCDMHKHTIDYDSLRRRLDEMAQKRGVPVEGWPQHGSNGNAR